MEVIYVNGKAELIDSNEDILDAVRRIMGEDFAKLLEDRLVDIDAETIYAKEKINSDLDYYEAQLGHNTTAFMDIKEIAVTLQEHTQEKRLNRDKIFSMATEIETLCKNSL